MKTIGFCQQLISSSREFKRGRISGKNASSRSIHDRYLGRMSALWSAGSREVQYDECIRRVLEISVIGKRKTRKCGRPSSWRIHTGQKFFGLRSHDQVLRDEPPTRGPTHSEPSFATLGGHQYLATDYNPATLLSSPTIHFPIQTSLFSIVV